MSVKNHLKNETISWLVLQINWTEWIILNFWRDNDVNSAKICLKIYYVAVGDTDPVCKKHWLNMHLSMLLYMWLQLANLMKWNFPYRK